MILKKSSKIYGDCMFAVRTEFENPEASKDYIDGYLKGVKACLFDLGFPSGTVTQVIENMLYIRSYVKGECDEKSE